VEAPYTQPAVWRGKSASEGMATTIEKKDIYLADTKPILIPVSIIHPTTTRALTPAHSAACAGE